MILDRWIEVTNPRLLKFFFSFLLSSFGTLSRIGLLLLQSIFSQTITSNSLAVTLHQPRTQATSFTSDGFLSPYRSIIHIFLYLNLIPWPIPITYLHHPSLTKPPLVYFLINHSHGLNLHQNTLDLGFCPTKPISDMSPPSS